MVRILFDSMAAWFKGMEEYELDPVFRHQLIGRQAWVLVQMAPALGAGSIVLSFLLLAMTAGSPLFPLVLVWSAALHAVVFTGMRAWYRAKRLRQPASRRPLARATLTCLSNGVLWGVLPVIILPEAQPAVALVAIAGVAGVLCASCLALPVLPRAALALVVPAFAGLLWASLGLEPAAVRSALLILLVTYAVIAAAVSIPLARRFTRNLFVESKLQQQKNIISLLLREFGEHPSDWLWELDAEGRIISGSERFSNATAHSRELVAGCDLPEFLRACSPDNHPVAAELEKAIREHAPFRNAEVKVQAGDDDRWWRLAGKPVQNEFGEHVGYVGTASDITAEKLAQNRISFLAHNDALTGLLNREKFSEQLKQSVGRLERYGTPFAILYLDLDQFKPVNDSYGHMTGDRLLVEVSRRIRTSLRPDDLAARLGGDEFAIILNNNCDSWNAAGLAARLVEAVAKPYEIEGESISIGVSIGIALAPVNGTRPDQLLRNADLALYRAKADGRGAYRFFESQMDSEARERRMLELELRQALKEKTLALHYQPLISAETGRPSGFEALVRWYHPIRGVVSPAEFIPIAEQTGLIRQIGDWTISEACNAAAGWPDDLYVAVNLSVRHFELSDIVSVVKEALARSGLAPHRLELEITEGLLLKNADEVVAKLQELKTLGVTVAMDDFGTGYSSLSYLLKFPFDKIKIDKTFVTASSDGPAARDILRTIASLGTILKIQITAEGVETEAQLEFLRDISCHHFQGYYFSKPLDRTELAGYLLNNFAQRLRSEEAGNLEVDALPRQTTAGARL